MVPGPYDNFSYPEQRRIKNRSIQTQTVWRVLCKWYKGGGLWKQFDGFWCACRNTLVVYWCNNPASETETRTTNLWPSSSHHQAPAQHCFLVHNAHISATLASSTPRVPYFSCPLSGPQWISETHSISSSHQSPSRTPSSTSCTGRSRWSYSSCSASGIWSCGSSLAGSSPMEKVGEWFRHLLMLLQEQEQECYLRWCCCCWCKMIEREWENLLGALFLVFDFGRFWICRGEVYIDVVVPMSIVEIFGEDMRGDRWSWVR